MPRFVRVGEHRESNGGHDGEDVGELGLVGAAAKEEVSAGAATESSCAGLASALQAGTASCKSFLGAKLYVQSLGGLLDDLNVVRGIVAIDRNSRASLLVRG